MPIVNTTTTFDQLTSAVAGLAANGTYFAVWLNGNSIDTTTSGVSVRGRIMNADGSAPGADFQINQLSTSLTNTPSIARLSNGNVLVTWTASGGPAGDAVGSAVKGRLFDAAGTAIGGEFFVNSITTGSQQYSDVTALSNGGFAVSFTSASIPYVRLFNAAGVAVGSEFSTGLAETGIKPPDIAALSSGNIGVVTGASLTSVNLSIVSSTGSAVATNVAIPSGPIRSYFASITAIDASTFLVGWTEFEGGRGSVIKLQKVSSTGSLVGSQIDAGFGDEYSVVALGNGGFAVMGTRFAQGTFEIFASHYNSSGVALSSGNLVVAEASERRIEPEAALLSDGRVVVTWTSYQADGSGAGIRSAIVDTATLAFLTIPPVRTFGGPGNDYFNGGEFADYFDGLAGNDSASGFGGNDTFVGGAGNDIFIGGDGDDLLYGDEDDDSLIGGAGNDTIYGGTGNDLLTANAGYDKLIGGAGNDTYFVQSNLYLITEIAGEGTDTVSSRAAFTQLDVRNTLENLTYTGTTGGTLYGNGLANVLTGGSESDSLNGFGGADTLNGNDGNDYFYIDERDVVNGGAGSDAVYIQTNVGVTLNVGLSQVEYVVGYIGNDRLDASTSAVGVTLIGGGGADQLIGSSANDYLYIDAADALVNAGGGTNDVVAVLGTAGVILAIAAANAEYVIGGEGNDSLNAFGSVNAVTIQGGAGADFIMGGNANDRLFGNAGTDVFRPTVNAQYDVIYDFTDVGGANDDRLDMRSFGAAFDTLAEVLAATTQYSGASVINFGGGNQLYLYQVAKANLTADDFIFV